MARLDGVSTDELEAALGRVDGKKEAMRLVAALIYKRGPSVPMIADWLAVREATIYRWFDRIEAEPLDRAVRDRPRPGRPPALSGADRERLEAAVADPPTSVGYERQTWTLELVRRFIRDEFGVDYTTRHVRRLLDEADLSDRVPRSDSGGPDAEGSV